MDVLGDLRLAARGLCRVPGFAGTVIVVLAIGIAGTTLVFSIVNALLLRPLPYAGPEGLVVVEPSATWHAFEALREARAASYGAYSERAANVVAAGVAERTIAVAVSREFVPIAGVRVVSGRAFLPDEYRPAHDRVAMLTDALWQRRYGRSPAALGQTLTIDDIPHTIVGVLAPGFRTLAELYPSAEGDFSRRVGLVVPLAQSPSIGWFFSTDRSARGLAVIGRLRDGVNLDRAQAELSVLAPHRSSGDPRYSTYTLAPLRTAVMGDLWPKLAVLSVAVSVLLLVACVNVVNLLLARAEGRRREMATRLALGASFGQLARHALGETVLLSLAGGAAGVWLAWGGIAFVKRLAGPLLTRLHDVNLDAGVLAFAAAVSVGAGLLVGLLPVVRMWRSKPVLVLHAGANASSPVGRVPLSSLLVMLQVALSVTLVVAGTLLARDLARLLRVDVGFQPGGILTAEVSLSRHQYGPRDAHRFFDTLVERAAGLPGVEMAGFVHPVPSRRIYGSINIRPEGSLREHRVGYRDVSANYFSMLSIPLVAGRTFDERDTLDAPRVAVVNETMAEKYWGGARQALGQIVRPEGAGPGEGYTVVGVARDVRVPAAIAQPEMFFSTRQSAHWQRTLLLKGRKGVVAGLAGPLAEVMRQLDPHQPLGNVLTLDAIVFSHVARQRLLMAFVTAFAGLTLLLASVGVYGVMSYSVARRTQEIGVRLALGCTRGRLVRHVLARGAALIVTGIAVSLPLTLGLTWWFAAEFVGVSGTDPGSYIASVAVIATAGMLALVRPICRATLVDPLVVLRRE